MSHERDGYGRDKSAALRLLLRLGKGEAGGQGTGSRQEQPIASRWLHGNSPSTPWVLGERAAAAMVAGGDQSTRAPDALITGAKRLSSAAR